MNINLSDDMIRVIEHSLRRHVKTGMVLQYGDVKLDDANWLFAELVHTIGGHTTPVHLSGKDKK